MIRLRFTLCLLAAHVAVVARTPGGTRFASNKLWIRDPVAVNAPWRPIGRAQLLVSIAALNGQLYGASSTGYLLVREPVLRDTPWRIVGHAQHLAAMAALDGNLYAVSLAGELWMRPPVHKDVFWKKIGDAGSASGVIAITASNGSIYGATDDGRLVVWVNAGHSPVRWLNIGRAERVAALAALDGSLYAATTDNRLLVRASAHEARTWKLIGHAENVTAMTAIGGKLYAAGFTPLVTGIPDDASACAVWQTNELYSEARALIHAAKQAGQIRNRQECVKAANDPRELQNLRARQLTEVMTGSCAQCACAAEF